MRTGLRPPHLQPPKLVVTSALGGPKRGKHSFNPTMCRCPPPHPSLPPVLPPSRPPSLLSSQKRLQICEIKWSKGIHISQINSYHPTPSRLGPPPASKHIIRKAPPARTSLTSRIYQDPLSRAASGNCLIRINSTSCLNPKYLESISSMCLCCCNCFSTVF